MEAEIIKLLESLGMPIGISIFWVALYYTTKNHKQERESWQETHKELTNKVIDSMDKNTTVLSEIKTLINSRK